MIDVEYIRHGGDDLSVVNAARVSFDMESVDFEARDEKLIHWLAKHKHKSPFNHAFLTFRVQAPIFVMRQLVKHEYLPFNEVSRRYVGDGLEFFWPNDDDWRSQPTNVKQGSGEPLVSSQVNELKARYELLIEMAEDLYRDATNPGYFNLCREQARMFLPQSLMSTCIWSGSVFAFMKMVQLRTHATAQAEARYVAEKVSATIQELYPVTHAALLEYGTE